jgi:DNA-binding transcriptional LysR family regulator
MTFRHGSFFLFLIALSACTTSDLIESTESIESIRLESLDGTSWSFSNGEALATVFVFVRTDCPISNRYAPEMSRLMETYEAPKFDFRFVYVDPEEPTDAIRKHREEYSLSGNVIIDRDHRLVAWSGAEVTPEVAVLDEKGSLLYRGRIDDWYVDFGKARREASTHDLENVLQAMLAGEALAARTTKAVGCYIRDLSPEGI